MKLYMQPGPGQAPTDNGIGRVIDAMARHLPSLGFNFTSDPASADVVAFHAGTATGQRCDVLHNHGLYWADMPHVAFSRSNNVANQRILEAARRAKIITVPSEWVAEPFRRDMYIDPVVIGHGIDTEDWDAGTPHGGYILWNKNRPTDVCDPTPAWKLAERGFRVVSTFGPAGKIIPGLSVTGQLPFERMKPIIEAAEIYLATTPETFGIGTLEAMICGVPVLGYRWCGTADLVQHQVTGWLVEPGDLEGLREGAAWLRAHRAEVGASARAAALAYDWKEIMQQYAQIYEQAAQPERMGVSIVITNYNYGGWVSDALRSALWQQRPAEEIIVVDDGSTDDSREILAKFAKEPRVKVIFQENQGVAAARNHGIEASHYPFIVCLDADDMIGPEFVAALRPALERDRGLGIAYSGVRFIDPNGKDTGFTASKPFSWEIQTKAQVPPPTCVPSCCMFRKEMWRRAGGYRQKYAPAEDSEFWTRGLSLGFTAEMVTPETMFWYRGHEGSASRTRKYGPIDDNKPWLHDKIYPMAAPSFYVPAVRSYWRPVISVIIPVGPGHEALVKDAIESVIGQTVREWEIILVDDTGSHQEDFAFPLDRKYPFLKIEYTNGKEGAGAARNVGIRAARGAFVLFLDADDWLRPDALDLLLQATERTGYYSFSNHVEVHADGRQFNREIMPYDREAYKTQQVMHSVTALLPTEWTREVGGFDPDLPGWEEYDFFMRLAAKGRCGVLVRQGLLFYRVDTGTRRQISQKRAASLRTEFKKRFGGIEMPSCCGGNGAAILEAKRALGELAREPIKIADLPNEVRLEFTGPFLAPVGYTVNGRTYYGAKDELNRFINAPREDVEKLIATGRWKIIQPPPEARVRELNPEPMPPLPSVSGDRVENA